MMCERCAEAEAAPARHWCLSREISRGDPEPDPSVPEVCDCAGKHYH